MSKKRGGKSPSNWPPQDQGVFKRAGKVFSRATTSISRTAREFAKDPVGKMTDGADFAMNAVSETAGDTKDSASRTIRDTGKKIRRYRRDRQEYSFKTKEASTFNKVKDFVEDLNDSLKDWWRKEVKPVLKGLSKDVQGACNSAWSAMSNALDKLPDDAEIGQWVSDVWKGACQKIQNIKNFSIRDAFNNLAEKIGDMVKSIFSGKKQEVEKSGANLGGAVDGFTSSVGKAVKQQKNNIGVS